VEELPNILWLRVVSDDGLTGLGETCFMPKSIHSLVAPQLIGRPFNSIDLLGRQVRPYCAKRTLAVPGIRAAP